MRPTIPATFLLTLALPAGAAVFNVGPDGDYATLQSALDLAVANGEDDNIRIQAGTLASAGTSFVHAEDFYLQITGGFDASFSSTVEDPSATVLSGGASGRPLELTLADGVMQIDNLSFADGRAEAGGGMLATAVSGAELLLRDLVFRDNQAEALAVATGGGLRLVVGGEATVDLLRCDFLGNLASGASALGGGLAVEMIDGNLTASRLRIEGNEALATGTAQGGALHLHLGSSDNGFELARAQLVGNRVMAPTSSLGAGAFVANNGGSSQFALQGVVVADNLDDGEQSSDGQLQISSSGGTLALRSVAAYGGTGTGGIVATTSSGAQLLASNLTVAGNEGAGFSHASSSSQSHTLYNSLLFGNGGANFSTSLSGSGSYFEGFNTVDADPGVIDAGAGNYRLAAGSAAIDAGFSSIAGGVGTIDADGRDRITGPLIDRGAYEFVPVGIFSDGFED